MTDNKYLNKKELQEYLKLGTLKEVQRLRAKGLPTIVLGPKTIRFDKDAVDVWMSAQSTQKKGGQSEHSKDDFVLPNLSRK